MKMFKALWAYRSFIVGSVKRDFHVKYRNSLLGAIWAVINPLAMIVVYTVIFSQVMQAKLVGADTPFAYSVYLCSGILTWSLFAEMIGRGQNVFIENSNLLKKISFPRICLPVIVLTNAVLNFFIVITIFLGFLVVAGLWPGWAIVAVIPVLLIQLLFAIGLGVMLGVLNVFFRDVGHFFGIFIQFWFWGTPIVYPESILPATLRHLMAFNPMYPLITAYQRIFVSGEWPNWETLWYPLILAVVLCSFAIRLFRKRAGEMVDEL